MCWPGNRPEGSNPSASALTTLYRRVPIKPRCDWKGLVHAAAKRRIQTEQGRKSGGTWHISLAEGTAEQNAVCPVESRCAGGEKIVRVPFRVCDPAGCNNTRAVIHIALYKVSRSMPVGGRMPGRYEESAAIFKNKLHHCV